MLLPWRLRRTPDYEEGLLKARQRGLPRFDENLGNVLANAELTPTLNSTPIADEFVRVTESADPAHDYRVFLCYRVDTQAHACDLLWIEVTEYELDEA